MRLATCLIFSVTATYSAPFARFAAEKQNSAALCNYLSDLLPVHLPTSLPANVLDTFAQISNLTRSMIDDVSVPGGVVDVWYSGQRVWSEGFGVANKATGAPFTTDTITRIASVTKTFTATLLAMLVDMQVVSLDTTVAELIPNFSIINPFNNDTMTLAQLASHTAGLPDFSPVQDGLGNSTHEIVSALRNMTLRVPLGSFPLYSNLGFALLGNALAEYVAPKVGNGTWAALLDELLIQPMALTHSGAIFSPDIMQQLAPGYWFDGSTVDLFDWQWESPSGAMYSTASDLNAFLQTWAALVSPTGPTPAFSAFSRKTAREFTQTRAILPDFTWAVGMPWETYFSQASGLQVHSKSGNLPGYTANVAFIPKLQLSIVFLFNGMPRATQNGDPFIPAWEGLIAAFTPLLQSLQPPANPGTHPSDLVGTYALQGSVYYPTMYINITMTGFSQLVADGVLPSFPTLLAVEGDTARVVGNLASSSCEIDFFSGTVGYELWFQRRESHVTGFTIPGFMPTGVWQKVA